MGFSPAQTVERPCGFHGTLLVDEVALVQGDVEAHGRWGRGAVYERALVGDYGKGLRAPSRPPWGLAGPFREAGVPDFSRPGPNSAGFGYLRYVVTYRPNKKPEDDFSELANVLDDLKDHSGLFYLEVTCHALGRYQEALGTYHRALELRPNYPEALYEQGITLGGLNRPSEAIEAYDRALELEPDFPNALNNKTLKLYELGRLDEALEWLRRAWDQRHGIRDQGASVKETLKKLGHDPEERK
jgi:tetratricopeptide (TPR) repeat protein